MSTYNPTLTPIGRLENTRDRITMLRARADAMDDRRLAYPCVVHDLRSVRSLLDRLDRHLGRALEMVDALTDGGDQISERAHRRALELTFDQEPWLNYAAARLDATRIVYLSLRRTRRHTTDHHVRRDVA